MEDSSLTDKRIDIGDTGWSVRLDPHRKLTVSISMFLSHDLNAQGNICGWKPPKSDVCSVCGERPPAKALAYLKLSKLGEELKNG